MANNELFAIERRSPAFKTNLRRGWRIYAVLGHHSYGRREDETFTESDVTNEILGFMSKGTKNEKLLEIKQFSKSVGLTSEEAKKMIAEFLVCHAMLFNSSKLSFNKFWSEVEL